MAKKLKSIPKLKAALQEKVNKYIRLRDAGKPCISCGEYSTLQAGHYYAVCGYDGLRFDVDNIHGECARCNCWDESHLIGYSKNIGDRIDDVDSLDLKAAQYKMNGYKWTRIELEELRVYFNDLIKDFENR